MSDKENIFEAAAKIHGKASKKVETSKTPPKKWQAPNLQLNPEVEAMMARMKELQDDVKNKLQKIYQSHGVTEEQVAKYLSNPKNFTPFEWEQLKQAQDLIRSQNTMSLLIKDQTATSALVKKAKKPEELARERKGKTLGARKQWLPMR